MENIPKYCNVKNGREPRTGIHPLIDPILDETQGIIVYQEQVMEIARRMAGYSLGGADLLRRAMGKKNQKEMDEQKPLFLTGAAQNGVDAKKAEEVWNLLDKFANYGFNKSHAAAYGLVSYQTAWLKANHPVEFMAAVMNCDIHLTDKLAVYKREVGRLGIAIEPPCVNRSEATFSVRDGRIVYALGALKGVGVEAMKLITAARGDRPFADLFDVAARVDLRKVGKRALEMLARAGAFDALSANRRRVLMSLDALVAHSAALHEAAVSDQVSLFGDAAALPAPRLWTGEDWPPTERLTEEYAAVGFYLSGHPLDAYAAALQRKRVLFQAEVVRMAARTGVAAARMAGSVMKRQERKSARGNRFAFVELSDPTGLYEVTVFADVLMQARDLLEPGRNVVLTVEAEAEGEGVKLLCRGVQAVDAVTADAAADGLRVFVSAESAIVSLKARLEALPQDRRGGPVELVVSDPALGADIEIALPGAWLISPEVRGAIKAAAGVVHVEGF
jgi:DNA polymerase-3 subunit alpha